jgi:hypothetical protein
MSDTATKRRSPEVRSAPMAMLVFDEPLPLPDAYAERFALARPRMSQGEGRLPERKTPLAEAMVERVPADGRWYLSAICYSPGQATALSSHISRGGYGRNVQVAQGPIPNANRRGMKREHAVLLKRTAAR